MVSTSKKIAMRNRQLRAINSTGCGGCRCVSRDFAEREVGLEASEGFTVQFRIRVDEVVERVAFLVGGQTNVATVCEKDAIDVMGTEEIVALGRIFPSFGGIDRNPSNTTEIKLRLAVIAGYVAFRF
jgi:hypothetical protein